MAFYWRNMTVTYVVCIYLCVCVVCYAAVMLVLYSACTVYLLVGQCWHVFICILTSCIHEIQSLDAMIVLICVHYFSFLRSSVVLSSFVELFYGDVAYIPCIWVLFFKLLDVSWCWSFCLYIVNLFVCLRAIILQINYSQCCVYWCVSCVWS